MENKNKKPENREKKRKPDLLLFPDPDIFYWLYAAYKNTCIR
jgi:hypothetical protein